MIKKPLVSIIIVNFNGRKLLEDCLHSVYNINFPKKNYEVILFDNNSQDDSVNYVKNNFPKIKLIESDKNLGFGKANNEAFKHSKGKYIVILNSDTRVDKNWLKELIRSAESNKKTAIVNSKLYFDKPFIKITIQSETELASNIYNNDNFSPYGLLIENIFVKDKDNFNEVWYLSGFYPKIDRNVTNQWTNGNATILVPVTEKNVNELLILIHGHPINNLNNIKYQIKIGDKVIKKGQIKSRELQQIKIKLDTNLKEVQDSLEWMVQNAGNVIFKNGKGRDRGSVIRRNSQETKEFYDFDDDYYYEKNKLLSMCGASCLIKRKIIDKIGFFDPNYFMYYEDVDFSLKVIRYGYDILFEPKSIVYHKHKMTTNKQNSNFFTSVVNQSYLIFLLKHFPISLFMFHIIVLTNKVLIRYLIIKTFIILGYYGHRRKHFYDQLTSYKSALFGVLKVASSVIYERNYLNKNAKMSLSQLISRLY